MDLYTSLTLPNSEDVVLEKSSISIELNRICKVLASGNSPKASDATARVANGCLNS